MLDFKGQEELVFKCTDSDMFVKIHRFFEKEFGPNKNSCFDCCFEEKYDTISVTQRGEIGFCDTEWYIDEGLKVYYPKSYSEFMDIIVSGHSYCEEPISIWDFYS